MFHLSLFVFYAATALLAYILTTSIYNVFFHPLRDIPGPLIRKISILPKALCFITGDDVAIATKLHQRYGPIVRLGPDDVSFISAQAQKDIYLRPGQKQIPKSLHDYMPDPIDRARGSLEILSSNGATHARMRKLLAVCFSNSALKEQEPLIMSHIDLLISKLRENSKQEPCDLAKMYNCATFDIMGDLAFGEPLGALNACEYTFFLKSIFGALRVFTVIRGIAITPFLSSAFSIFVRVLKVGQEQRYIFKKYTLDMLDRRLARNTDKKDFLSYILRYNDERGLSKVELRDNAEILTIAGSETSATALSGITFNILTNPECLQKLQGEIRSRFKSDKEILPTAAMQLPYLKAVIEESMRIYPPAPAGLNRKTVETELIDGVIIPPNTTVYVTAFAANHCPMNFKNPDKFMPERCTGVDEYADDDRDAFQPFSHGVRNCIGRGLAQLEMCTIMSKMIYHFDMELEDASRDWLDQKVFLLWEKKPLMVKLTPRRIE